MKNILYLLAGGTANRFGGDKLLMPAAGGSILTFIAKKVISFSLFTEIVIVCNEEKRTRIKNEGIEGLYFADPGKERYHSVLSAFNTVPPGDEDTVLIHDAARPLVSKELCGKIIERTKEMGNAFPALRVADTLRYYREDGSSETLERDGLYLMQTPQGFKGKLLKKIMEHTAGRPGITDEGVVLETIGEKIHLVEGERDNYKITFLSDYKHFCGLIDENGRI